MANVHHMKQGDLKPPVVATLKDGNGDVIPLEGTTVRFRMDGKVLGDCSLLTPTGSGRCQYDWVAGQTDKVGRFKATFVIEHAGPKPQSVPAKNYVFVEIEPKA